MRATLPFAALLAWSALAGAAELEFQPVLNADLRGGQGGTINSVSAYQVLGEAHFVPALRLAGGSSLLPTFSLNLGGQERSVQEGALFVSTANLAFKPALSTQLPNGDLWTLRGQAQHMYNIQSFSESWGQGLYDYEQYGGGAGYTFSAERLGFGLGVGMDAAYRGYANFRNVPSASLLLGGRNSAIKDLWSVSGQLEAGLPWGTKLAYRPEWKGYVDAYVTLQDGTTDLNQLQRDWVHSLEMSKGWSLTPTLGLETGLNFGLNDSNHAKFDLEASRFVPDDQDYASQALSLALPWKASALLSGLELTPAGTFTLRQTQKPVQNALGEYTESKQDEWELGLKMRGQMPMFWGMSAVLTGGYTVVRSNQDLVKGISGNYESWEVGLGMQMALQGAPKVWGATEALPATEGAPSEVELAYEQAALEEEIAAADEEARAIARAEEERYASEDQRDPTEIEARENAVLEEAMDLANERYKSQPAGVVFEDVGEVDGL